MAHLLQVGAGSGGMPVLDMLCRDPRINEVTLIEPDVYKQHNVERHLFQGQDFDLAQIIGLAQIPQFNESHGLRRGMY